MPRSGGTLSLSGLASHRSRIIILLPKICCGGYSGLHSVDGPFVADNIGVGFNMANRAGNLRRLYKDASGEANFTELLPYCLTSCPLWPCKALLLLGSESITKLKLSFLDPIFDMLLGRIRDHCVSDGFRDSFQRNFDLKEKNVLRQCIHTSAPGS